MARLGDYINIKTGKLDANAATKNGRYPFFTCSATALKIDVYSYDCECVLVAGNGDLNVKYYKGKFNAYQRTYIVESKDKKEVSVRYLYYFLDAYLEILRKEAIGGVIKYIKLGNLTEAPFPYVNIEEQKKAVAFLDKISLLISKRRRQIEKLDLLVKARFGELFGDVYLNTQGYKEEKLERVADIVSGITKGRKTKNCELIEVPYMAVSNVKDGYIDWTTVKTILATEEEISRYRLEPQDILMTEGGDPDKLGRGAVIREPLKNCIHQNHIFRVRLDTEQAAPEYFEAYLQSIKIRRYFLTCAKKTTGIASINMTQLRSMPVLLPPLKTQEEFTEYKAKVEELKGSLQKSLKALEAVKKSFMQTCFGSKNA